MGGEKSKVETIKEQSGFLRGTIRETLGQDTDHFSNEDYQVLKFHGIYQQNDRDLKRQLKRQKEKRYIFMIRSKVPAGRLTAEQYLVHDWLADRYANGTLRITTRQDFQLHGVLKSGLEPTLRAINRALVTTLGACGDLERNVVSCPAPAPGGLRDELARHARRISDHLLPRTRAYHEIWLDGEKVHTTQQDIEPLYGPGYMPRKFKTGIGLPGDNCVDIFTHDIGLLAFAEGNRLHGFNVLAGGGMGMTHGKEETYPRLASPLAFVPAGEILPVVEAILTIQRDHGNRADRKTARLKYLLDAWGFPRFREEVERRAGRKLAAPLALPIQDVHDHLGWSEEGGGRWYVGIPVENGRIKDESGPRLKGALREVIGRYRPSVRLTPLQSILLCGIGEGDRAGVEAILRDHGVPSPGEISPARRWAMACPALPTCGLALTEAERVMPDLVKRLEDELHSIGLGNERIVVHMTGCPNGCARPYSSEVGVVGRTADTYNIYLGGGFEGTRLNHLYAEKVALDEIVPALSPLLAGYATNRRPGERFGDFCHRLGMENLRRMSGAYRMTGVGC